MFLNYRVWVRNIQELTEFGRNFVENQWIPVWLLHIINIHSIGIWYFVTTKIYGCFSVNQKTWHKHLLHWNHCIQSDLRFKSILLTLKYDHSFHKNFLNIYTGTINTTLWKDTCSPSLIYGLVIECNECIFDLYCNL